MYIIFELDELTELVQAVQARTEPDVPIDTSANPSTLKLYDRVAHLLDTLLAEDYFDGEVNAEMQEIAEDEFVRGLAFQILDFVTSRMMIRDRIDWIKVLDHHGGLVIRIRPGAK